MLLALSGVTGVGKTYSAEHIAQTLGFQKVTTIRTRAMRAGEKNGVTGLFMTSDELDRMDAAGEIAYRFSVFGGEYGYLASEIFSDRNLIMEMHYTEIDKWRAVRPDMKAIYILPSDLNVCKKNVFDRHLALAKETERLREIDEQYSDFMTNPELQAKFDRVFTNFFTPGSEAKLTDIVRQMALDEQRERAAEIAA